MISPILTVQSRVKLTNNKSTPIYVLLDLLAVEDNQKVKACLTDAIQEASEKRFAEFYVGGRRLQAVIARDPTSRTNEQLLREYRLFEVIDKMLALELKGKMEAMAEVQPSIVPTKGGRHI